MPTLKTTRIATLALLGISVLATSACTSHYAIMEKHGFNKRDLLVKEVERSRNEQEAARVHFQTALDEFASIDAVAGYDLEVKYHQLRRELERCEDDAKTIHNRIKSIERVADDLFDDWDDELDEYNSAGLRRAREKQFNQTKEHYKKLVGTMKQAESKTKPALRALRDQVLFLKQNVNARAVYALQGAEAALETDVTKLIAQLQTSINETGAFVAYMEAEKNAAPPDQRS